MDDLRRHITSRPDHAPQGGPSHGLEPRRKTTPAEHNWLKTKTIVRRSWRNFRRTYRNWRFELIAIVVSLFLLLLGAIIFWAANLTLPNLNSFDDRKVDESTKIYDRTGTILLYDVYQDTRRTVVPYDDISVNLKNATVAIEDAQFYQNNGIDIKGIFRAILADIFSLGYSQGGSTITQQVVRNSLLTTDKSITRKLKEIILSIRLSEVMSKEDILDLYLNDSPYGGSIYGVEEASQTYFGTSSANVDLAQAAYIAALPQSPTYYDPYGGNLTALTARKNLVLQAMKDNNFITQDQYNQAVAENVTFLPQDTSSIKAPHFVMFIKQYLVAKYGEDEVDNGGLKVITTLNYDLEEKAEAILKSGAATNTIVNNASNDALVAIDPKTGQILAMVGSRDYFDTTIDGQFNVATATRQPGSSFKPFVYAEAFNKGYTPDTVVFDVPTQFSTSCAANNFTDTNGCYSPVNYDGKFIGPVNLRDAIAQSRNVPSIQVFYLAGLADSLNLARQMGITTLNADVNTYGLTLVLGGGEVSLLDMTSAYSVFANAGVRNPYTGILSVTDSSGKTLEQYTPAPQQVLPANTSYEIDSVLSDDVAREPEYGVHSALWFSTNQVAVKTGTTNDTKDAWVIGYTPSIAVGMWAGNNDDTPMVKTIAGYIVAPMWHEFMIEALKTVPVETFPDPAPYATNTPPIIRGLWQGGTSYTIDSVSGLLATQYTPAATRVEKVIPDVHSILYWIDKANPTVPRPANDPPSNDPQFRLWEYPAELWATQNGYPTTESGTIPTQYDDVHVPGKIPTISLSFANNTNSPTVSEFSSTQTITVHANVSAAYPITKGSIYIDDKYFGALPNSLTFSFRPSDLGLTQAFNDIRVDVTDSVMNTVEATTTFSLSN